MEKSKYSEKRIKIKDKDRESIYIKSNGKCVDCGLICGGGWKYHKPHLKHFELNGSHEIHHVIPLHKGGKTTKENLILLCISCHQLRHKIEGVK